MRKILPHICLMFCVLFLTQSSLAQSEPQERKVFEYSGSKATDIDFLKSKTKQFVEKLVTEPKGTKGLIVTRFPVTQLPCKYEEKIEKFYEPVRQMIVENFPKLNREVRLDIGRFNSISERSVEFWLIPAGMEIPEYLLIHPPIGVCCGNRRFVEERFDPQNRENEIKFKVESSGERDSKKDPIYKWKISAGKIVSGQGTNQISVDASETNAKEITATAYIQDVEFEECSFEETSTVYLRNKAFPILFDTYSETSDHGESLLTAYTDRFAKALREAPETTKGVIIVYSGSHENRCSKDERFVEKKFKFLQRILTDNHKIATDRISSMFELWRECNEVEFWLVPKNADMPEADPHLILDYECGDLTISGIEKVDSKTQFIYFNAYVSGGNDASYKWTVSAGKIVEGQGSSKIKVDISGVYTQEVKASVEFQDTLVELCTKKDSFTTQIIP